MKKGLIIITILAFVLSIAGTTLAAPAKSFPDVPKTHWAYAAVTELARVGIIDGYTDGTFRGDKTMTRYEMSQIVAKAMANSNKATAVQKALIDKLAIEFALELNNIASRVAKLEQNQPKVQFSGAMLTQYKYKSQEDGVNKGQPSYYIRLNGKADIDDKTSLSFRWNNAAPQKDNFRAGKNVIQFGDVTNQSQIDRVWVTSKLGVVNVSLGRQALALDPEDVIVDGGYFSYDGVRFNWKDSNFNYDLKFGRFTNGVTATYAFNGLDGNANSASADYSNIDVKAANVSSKSGKLDYGVGVAQFKNWKNSKSLMNYTYFNAGWNFDKKFSMGSEYGKNRDAREGGAFWTVKGVYGDQSLNAKGKNNFTVQYWKGQKNSVNGAYTAIDTYSEGFSDSFKTLDFSYRYMLSKAIVGKLQYAKVTDHDTSSESYNFWKAQVIYKF